MKRVILSRNLWSHIAERISALWSRIRSNGASLAEECHWKTSLLSNAFVPVAIVAASTTTISTILGPITVASSSPYGTKPFMPSPYMPLTE